MKTISISAELSSLALETVSQTLTPSEIISKVKNSLSQKFEIMGNYIGTELNHRRQLGDSLELDEYHLSYEKHVLQFEFIHFKPRGDWQVKGFRFV